MNPILVAIICAVTAAFVTAYLLIDLFFGRTPMQRRLAALKLFTVHREQVKIPLMRRILTTAGRYPLRYPALIRLADRDVSLLDRIGGVLKPTEWLVIRFATGVVLGLVLVVASRFFTALLVGLLLGFFGANGGLLIYIKKRERTFADELPGALGLMISSLRSGFTLHQSVEASVRDDEGPVAVELRRALAETRISGNFEDALERVGERMNSSEMVWLVMALRLQREVGGSLVDVMQTTADTMRERAYLHRHVRALSGEGRVSAYVLTAMPIVSAGAIYLTEPDYLKPLVTETAGLAMLGVAVAGVVLGALWLRVVVKVEV
ncbi:tight adherence protein B [Actinoplanes lutulentus]|uniref:Tight adherence protein B n=1 Tax=Actinoplanes lutulentus TaxID=1287878 RepID=A0A327ZDD5_9ACTN|nr:type II secretion system F family protein [Actinoplanes lutulentus]MBB2941254.1 tight adherence protein B [Actinoplanes lutulentus]RAK36746.1 tight adherence protein B [Actinoplanes lutulentus]